MFYETHHFLQNESAKIHINRNLNFPSHLHSNFELIVVTKGEMLVTIDKKQYRLTENKAVLIFPNQTHALKTPQACVHTLCIFSPQLIRAYSSTFLSKRPDTNLFSPTPFYIEKLQRLKDEKSMLALKGLLYSMCAEFDACATYHEHKSTKEDLLLKIFRFVEANYSSDCSLTALSAHTTYHSVYLSRYFKQCVGIPFTEYVNRYRINEACDALKNSAQSIVEVAYDCGFDSLRSFNRNFKKITGMPPGAYRDRS